MAEGAPRQRSSANTALPLESRSRGACTAVQVVLMDMPLMDQGGSSRDQAHHRPGAALGASYSSPARGRSAYASPRSNTATTTGFTTETTISNLRATIGDLAGWRDENTADDLAEAMDDEAGAAKAAAQGGGSSELRADDVDGKIRAWMILPQLLIRLIPPLMILHALPDVRPRADNFIFGLGWVLVSISVLLNWLLFAPDGAWFDLFPKAGSALFWLLDVPAIMLVAAVVFHWVWTLVASHCERDREYRPWSKPVALIVGPLFVETIKLGEFRICAGKIKPSDSSLWRHSDADDDVDHWTPKVRIPLTSLSGANNHDNSEQRRLSLRRMFEFGTDPIQEIADLIKQNRIDNAERDTDSLEELVHPRVTESLEALVNPNCRDLEKLIQLAEDEGVDKKKIRDFVPRQRCQLPLCRKSMYHCGLCPEPGKEQFLKAGCCGGGPGRRTSWPMCLCRWLCWGRQGKWGVAGGRGKQTVSEQRKLKPAKVAVRVVTEGPEHFKNASKRCLEFVKWEDYRGGGFCSEATTPAHNLMHLAISYDRGDEKSVQPGLVLESSPHCKYQREEEEPDEYFRTRYFTGYRVRTKGATQAQRPAPVAPAESGPSPLMIDGHAEGTLDPVNGDYVMKYTRRSGPGQCKAIRDKHMHANQKNHWLLYDRAAEEWHIARLSAANLRMTSGASFKMEELEEKLYTCKEPNADSLVVGEEYKLHAPGASRPGNKWFWAGPDLTTHSSDSSAAADAALSRQSSEAPSAEAEHELAEVKGFYTASFEITIPRTLHISPKAWLGVPGQAGTHSTELLILQIEQFAFFFFFFLLLGCLLVIFMENRTLPPNSPVGIILGTNGTLLEGWTEDATAMRWAESELFLPIAEYCFLAFISASEFACFSGRDSLATSREDRWYQRALEHFRGESASRQNVLSKRRKTCWQRTKLHLRWAINWVYLVWLALILLLLGRRKRCQECHRAYGCCTQGKCYSSGPN
eukprot:COSAG05_NODE_1826_length_4009_cov_8.578261_1_plen_975_part_01